MTAKMSAKRRAAFLRALGKTGNYAVAAEQAGVSRGWVLKARHEAAEFDAACREAVAEVAARLQTAAGMDASGRGRSWGHLDGVELVARGTGGSGGGRRVQIGRARAHRWGPRTEARFLAVLAATCNVKAAYEAAGMTKGSAYTHRRRRPDFAARWDEAVHAGYRRIEAGLLENAINYDCEPDVPPDVPMLPMRFEDALQVLHMHQNKVLGIGRAPGRRAWRA